MRKKKSLFAIVAALFASVFGLALSACGNKTTPAPPSPVFTLDKTHVELTEDGSLEVLTLTIANVDEEPQWSSSNTDVASVATSSSANKVTVRPEGKGQAVVSAVAGEYIAVCTVKVNKSVDLELLTPSISLLSGTTSRIEVETDATTLTYASDNRSVATVDQTGLVSGVSGGTAHITVSGGGKSVVCNVTVTDPYVTLDKSEVLLTLEDGSNSYLFTAQSNGEIEWDSDDPDIATVEDGLVTAVAVGNTKITASYASAKAECVIKVKEEILSVTLSETAHTLVNGDTFALSATIAPEQTGDDAKIAWSVVSGNDLVTVDGDGNVTATSNKIYGTATVRATSVKDPDAYADCTITVPDPYGDWTAISTAAGLKNLSVNGKYYLACDIDFDGIEITDSYIGDMNNVTLDGRGYSIKNITTNFAKNEVGFINKLIGTTVIQNVNFIGFDLGGTSAFVHGGIIERADGLASVKNCYFEGTISARGTFVGPIGAKFGGGSIENCLFNVTVNGAAASATNNPRSAIARWFAGEVKNCYTVKANNVFAAGNGDNNSEKYAAAIKTLDELKSESLYNSTWEAEWVIVDGELPYLKNALKKEPLKIRLDRTAAAMYVGEELTLNAIVTPAGLSDDEKAVVWESSDNKTVTVVNGVVHAVKAGTATITVSSAEEPDKTATCVVTVNAVTISIDTAVTELKTGSQKQLEATVNHGEYTWESSDDNVATVDDDGLVSAVGAGPVTITVRSSLDPTVTDSVTLEVKDNIVITVTLSDDTLSLDRDDTHKLTATVVNSDGGVNWSSDNEAVATVDADGNITTHGVNGTAVITATAKEDGGSGNYASASCTVNVAFVPVTVELNSAAARDLILGATLDITEIVTVNKGGLTATVTDGAECVSIENGIITAIADGTATVRIFSDVSYADHPAVYTDITVTVYTPAVEMSINASRYSTDKVSTTLRVTLDNMPASASASDIVWTSSDTSVIGAVTGGLSSGVYTGTFTPKAYGFSTVTASYTYGGRTYTASCEVEVFNANGARAISTAAGLKSMAANGKYYLACDIDFDGVEITSNYIGNMVSITLDGRGYSIKNIKTNFADREAGFISMLDGLTVIQNVNFTGFDIGGTSAFMYGGIIRHIDGSASVKNCYFEGIISAPGNGNEAYIGPIGAKFGGGSIENCIFNVGFGERTMSGNKNANPRAMIARWIGGNVKNCFAFKDSINGANVSAAPGDGNSADKCASSFKTTEELETPSTYDDSWSAWVIEDGQLPRVRTGWDN